MDAAYRKVVVIGASAGGIEAVARVIGDLPADIRAAFFVVVHLNASVPSMLAQILGRRTALEVLPAADGLPIQAGRVYTALPGFHLLIDGEVMRLGRGPLQNNFRPAVDPLFRTAAEAYGPQVIGVVLSGNLDDGTAGLMAVKKRGGTAIVQDLEDATYPGMPASAIQEVPDIDFVLPASDIGRVIANLTGNADPLERHLPRLGSAEITLGRDFAKHSNQSPFGCPNCGGVLQEERAGELVLYRCRVGHMFSDEALLAAQTENLETALWTALRALEEAAEQSNGLAERIRGRGHAHLAERFVRQRVELLRRAEIVRHALDYTVTTGEQVKTAG